MGQVYLGTLATIIPGGDAFKELKEAAEAALDEVTEPGASK